MPLENTSYIPIADEDAFSQARFRSQTWFSLANNLNHFAASRGRLLVKSYHMENYTAISTGAVSEIFRWVVDRTPEENVLYAQAVFMVRALHRVRGVTGTITWRIDTDNVSAGAAESGEGTQTFEVGARQHGALVRERQHNALQFPHAGASNIYQDAMGVGVYQISDVQKHTLDTSGATFDTVIKLMASKSNDLDTWVGLAGLAVWGVHSEDAV